MRSHPLLLKLGTGATPSVRRLDDVQMLELDDGFSRVQKEFGADLYKAADWRWDTPLPLPGNKALIITGTLVKSLSILLGFQVDVKLPSTGRSFGGTRCTWGTGLASCQPRSAWPLPAWT